MSAIEDLASYIFARMPSETPQGELTTWDELTDQQREIYRAHARNAALTFPDQYPEAAAEMRTQVTDEVTDRARAALENTNCTDDMQDFFQVGLVRELLAEVERLQNQVEILDHCAYEVPIRTPHPDTRMQDALDALAKFDVFMRTWVQSRWHAHLSDNDDNDAERVRDAIRAETEKREEIRYELGQLLEVHAKSRAEVDRLKVDADNWKSLWQQNTETAAQAMRERDEANAEVERLRGALDAVHVLANNAAATGWRDTESQSMSEAAGMQTVGETIATEIEAVLRDDQ